MDVKDIVKEYLNTNGFDGLFHPDQCACLKDDVAPCDNIGLECQAGYRTAAEPDSEHDWMVGPLKDGEPTPKGIPVPNLAVGVIKLMPDLNTADQLKIIEYLIKMWKRTKSDNCKVRDLLEFID